MIPEDLSDFARSLRSLWAIELLLLLYRDPGRAWSADDLVRELRSSALLVAEVIALLERMEVVHREPDDRYRYRPATPELGELVVRLDRLHAERPLSLAREIHTSPNEKLRAFSDAFRLKKE